MNRRASQKSLTFENLALKSQHLSELLPLQVQVTDAKVPVLVPGTRPGTGRTILQGCKSIFVCAFRNLNFYPAYRGF